MATNVFFNHAVKTEQNLYEDLVVESLRMYGHEVLYLPREVVELDSILNEDVQSTFGSAYSVEMYLENVEGIAEAGDLMSKFGVYVQEEATFIISVRSWDRFVSGDSNLATSLRPNEGDIIYFPMSGSMFEIRYVVDDNPFYQLGKLFVYKMQCSLFEYSGEEFETGTDADQIETDRGQTFLYPMENITGSFTYGENILLNSNVIAECVGWVGSTPLAAATQLVLRGITGTIGSGDILTGQTSGAIATVSSIPSPLNINDGDAQNQEFETAGSNYLDFSETNPFGEV